MHFTPTPVGSDALARPSSQPPRPSQIPLYTSRRPTKGIQMKITLTALVLLTLIPVFLQAAPTDDVYKLGPDSNVQPNVPQGKVVGPLTLASNVYPNTTRNYWVYVPIQYDPKTPASLMIFQDGHYFVNP